MAEEKQTTGGALSSFVKNTGLATREDRVAKAAALEAAADRNMSGNADMIFLTYSGKRDRWALGREKASPDPDAIYVIDPDTVVEGWEHWKDSKPIGKHEWSVYDADTRAVPASQLDQLDGDGWQEMMGWMMFDVDDPSLAIKFTTSSKSGLNAVGELAKEMRQRLVDGEAEIPLVKLSSEMFTAKGHQNGKPQFPVEGWAFREEVEVFVTDENVTVEQLLNGDVNVPPAGDAEPEPDPEPEPEAPKASGRRRSKPAEPVEDAQVADEPEPEPAAAPRRQRRRRAA